MGPALGLGIGAAIQGIGSLIGGHQQANAAKDAAAIQAASADKAMNFDQQQYSQAQGLYQPYLSQGVNANARLQDYLNANANPEQYAAFTGPTSYNDRGYDFTKGESLDALRTSLAAHGTSPIGGPGLKALMGRADDLASTHINDVFNRSLAAYQAGLGAFNANNAARQQQFGNLFDLSQMGYGAAQGLGNLGSQYARSYSDLITGQGNANAAGKVGAASAWGNAISGVGNAANSYLGYLYGRGGQQYLPSGSSTSTLTGLIPNYQPVGSMNRYAPPSWAALSSKGEG